MDKKYIDAEKLRSVLQNTINSMKEKDAKGERYDAFLNGKLSICEELLGCIDSLQQEQPSLPSNIDEAAEEYSINKQDAINYLSLWISRKQQQNIRVIWHFINQEDGSPTCRRCSPEQARMVINGRG